MTDEQDEVEHTDSFELSLDEADDSIDTVFEDALNAVDKPRRSAAADPEAEPEAEVEIEVQSEPEDDPIARPKTDPLEIAKAETEALRERLLRTMADFDNFRRRNERERREAEDKATGNVLRDVLEVVDNLERALASSGKLDELKQGVEMILRQLVDVMRRRGVEKVESVGRPFDPNLHEAVAREEGSPNLSGPTVASEMQAGYKHGDRLLRPAMVMVAVPGTKPAGAADEPEPEPDFEVPDEMTDFDPESLGNQGASDA